METMWQLVREFLPILIGGVALITYMYDGKRYSIAGQFALLLMVMISAIEIILNILGIL